MSIPYQGKSTSGKSDQQKQINTFVNVDRNISEVQNEQVEDF